MPDKLTGFTIFKVSKGWQMSTRFGDDAWSVRIVADEVAQEVFDLVHEMAARFPPNHIPRVINFPAPTNLGPTYPNPASVPKTLFEMEAIAGAKVRFKRGN